MEERLTMKDLEKAANKLARAVLPTGQYEPISERTIRYWISQDLLPRSGGPRKAALYAPEVVHLCVFIRRLQKLELLTLDQIRGVIADLDGGLIRHIVETSEPIQIANLVPDEELHQRVKKGEHMIALRAAQSRQIRRPTGSDSRSSDKPQRLDTISDLEKAAAISMALDKLGVPRCKAEIQSTSYDRFGPRGSSFKEPARLEVLLVPSYISKGEDPFHRIRAIPDVVLCQSIGEQLTDLTGETLAVELASKHYPRSMRLDHQQEIRFNFLIARNAAIDAVC